MGHPQGWAQGGGTLAAVLTEAILGSCLGLGMLMVLAITEMVLEEVARTVRGVRPRPRRVLEFRRRENDR